MGKAGIALVEIKFNPGDLERMQAEAKVNGKLIADEMSQGADKNGGFFKKLSSGFVDLGRQVQTATDDFGKFISESSFANGALAPLGQTISALSPTLGGLASVLGLVSTGAAGLAAALLVLPALAAAATFAFVALLDVATILSAVVAALAGPLAIVGALLGGLGVGFVLAGQRALKGGGPFKEFAKTMKDLQKQFSGVVKTLAVDFLPLFDRLAGAASTALTYLGQIAKLPLKKAFESLSTTGVAMFSKFVYGVANVLKKPFKLAIEIAFGSGGANAQSAITSWWDSLTKYLFGYSKSHPIHIGSAIVMDTKNVKGALDPIIKSFNSQHFVKTGIRWAHDIIDGLISLWNHDKGLRDAVKAIFKDAGNQAAKAFRAAFAAEMTNIPWKSVGLYILHQLDFTHDLTVLATKAFDVIKSHAGSVLGSIAGWISSKLSDAWGAVKSKATSIWNSIVGYIEGHIPHPHVDFGGILHAGEHIWDEIVSYIESHIPHPTIHLSIPTPSVPHITIPGTGITLPHTGGLVLPGGGLAFAGGGIARGGIPGRDSIPAMLTPGELVLNESQQMALLRGGIRGDTTVQVFIDGKEIQSAVSKVQRRTARAVQAGNRWG